MDENELLKKIFWTKPGGQRGRGRPKSRWIDMVVEIGWRIPRIDVAGDICLSRPRPTQGCRANDDDDDDE